MKKYYLHKVDIEVALSSNTGYFCEVYITENNNVEFVSIENQVKVDSVRTVQIKGAAAEHLLEHLGGTTEPENGYIEINGNSLEDSEYAATE